MSVLLFVEQRDGVISRLSLEAMSAAQEIARFLHLPVTAVVIGSNGAEAAAYGVNKVLLIEHPLLNQYTADGFTLTVEQIIQQEQPPLVVFPHSYLVRDFVPKLAARFRCGFISDVVSARCEENQNVTCVRQLFGGKLNVDVQVDDKLAFISIQAGAYPAAESKETQAPIETAEVKLAPEQIRSKPEAPFREAQRAVDLSRSNLIVSVGRGIQSENNLPMMRQLADVLGAELGASRPICDQNWLPMERQVGSSGQTVAPKGYFAIGISGAIQHIVGMKGARTIVAINKDENAPIFEIADYGIVGDLLEVVPALIEEVKKAKS